MPKKTANARGAQRHKPKAQKNVQLVRQAARAAAEHEQELENELEHEEEATTSAVTASIEPTETAAPVEARRPAKSTAAAKKVEVDNPKTVSEAEASTASAPKSAAARLAARRQGAQKAQQRSAASLITAEHYSYVRRDLIVIGILALIMFSAIIILHFVPGIGS